MKKNDENFIKFYEKILFITWITFFSIQILSIFIDFLQNINGVGFIILLIMFSIWAFLIGNKDLSSYEIILAFGFIGYVIYQLAGIVFYYLGYVGWKLFGMYTEHFLGLIFIIMFFLSMFFCFYKIIKNQKKSKISFLRSDLIILYIALTIIVIVILIYILQ